MKTYFKFFLFLFAFTFFISSCSKTSATESGTNTNVGGGSITCGKDQCIGKIAMYQNGARLMSDESGLGSDGEGGSTSGGGGGENGNPTTVSLQAGQVLAYMYFEDQNGNQVNNLSGWISNFTIPILSVPSSCDYSVVSNTTSHTYQSTVLEIECDTTNTISVNVTGQSTLLQILSNYFEQFLPNKDAAVTPKLKGSGTSRE